MFTEMLERGSVSGSYIVEGLYVGVDFFKDTRDHSKTSNEPEMHYIYIKQGSKVVPYLHAGTIPDNMQVGNAVQGLANSNLFMTDLLVWIDVITASH